MLNVPILTQHEQLIRLVRENIPAKGWTLRSLGWFYDFLPVTPRRTPSRNPPGRSVTFFLCFGPLRAMNDLSRGQCIVHPRIPLLELLSTVHVHPIQTSHLGSKLGHHPPLKHQWISISITDWVSPFTQLVSQYLGSSLISPRYSCVNLLNSLIFM